MPDQKTPEQELPEWKPEIRRRLARLTLEPTRESSIVEELAQHLDEIYAELLASGATPAEAARLTRVQLRGSATLARELRRAARQVNPEPIVLGTNRRRNMIADLWQDLRYAARTLGKNPGFTLVVVVTLALGIGLNTAVYSVVDAVLFRPLPFAEPDRLVEIQQLEAKSGFSYPGLRWEAFQEWRSQTNLFVQVEAHEPRTYTLTGGKEPESVNAPAVTSGLFAMLDRKSVV